MQRTKLIFLFVISALVSCAQQVCTFPVYFSSNSSSLNTASVSKIDSVIKSLANISKAYAIAVSGHTDNTGSEALNLDLSKKRAAEVQKYFLGKGFLRGKTSVASFAAAKPAGSNDNEAGKAGNRRAEVSISIPVFDISKALNLKSSTESFGADAEKENKFNYSSGSELRIPADAFQDMAGRKVKGKVEVKYTEYRDNADFLLSGIPMSFFNEQKDLQRFNSAGMFKIEAFQNGKQLKLNPEKTITINFSKTQSLPDLNFFSFDSLHSKWNQTGTLNTINQGTFQGIQGHGWHGYTSCVSKINGKDSCILEPCVGTLFAIRKGLDLASGTNPVLLKQAKSYFLNTKDDPRGKIEAYSLKIISSSKKRREFIIVPLRENSVYDDFKNYSWIYKLNKKSNFQASLAKKTWLKVNVNYKEENSFELTLSNNSEKIVLPVTARISKGLSKKEMVTQNEINRDRNWLKVSDKNYQVNAFNEDTDLDLMLKDSLWNEELKQIGYDSLFCFYQYNKQWMDQKSGEDTLPYRKWLDYFNENKDLMLKRYQGLKGNSAVVASCEAEEKRRKEAARKQQVVDSTINENFGKQYNSLQNVFQLLAVKNLGIWNCDQVERLINPVYVSMKYKDAAGKTIEPIVIYVIDKVVQGTLTYNGYGVYSPYYFPISTRSESTLIAFDMENNGYICPSSVLQATITGKKPAALLNPLSDVKTKEDLNGMLR